MKTIKKILFVTLFLITASFYAEGTESNAIPTVDIGVERLLKFNPVNLKELQAYIASHFKYRLETVDHWSSPTEFMRNGYGDCEDYAIFVMYYASRLGYPVQLIVVKLKFEDKYHALVTINGHLCEPQTLTPETLDNYIYCESLSLNEALEKCYY